MTARSVAVTPFVFGKLPTHGDFVCRDLAPAERRRWDAWASAGLEAAAAALGPAFDEAHATAPPWRFVIATEHGWQGGAFAPSVDRVGRRFLIVAGVQVSGEPSVDLEAVAGRAEEAIYSAFAAGEDVDALHRRLAGPLPQEAGATAARAWTLGGERHAPQVVVEASLDSALLVAALTPTSAEAVA